MPRLVANREWGCNSNSKQLVNLWYISLNLNWSQISIGYKWPILLRIRVASGDNCLKHGWPICTTNKVFWKHCRLVWMLVWQSQADFPHSWSPLCRDSYLILLSVSLWSSDTINCYCALHVSLKFCQGEGEQERCECEFGEISDMQIVIHPHLLLLCLCQDSRVYKFFHVRSSRKMLYLLLA